jgi:hypothetical protein
MFLRAVTQFALKGEGGVCPHGAESPPARSARSSRPAPRSAQASGMSASRGRKVRAQLYQELGLSEGASEEDVKTAYRKLALQWCATRRLRVAAAAVTGRAVSFGPIALRAPTGGGIGG